MKNNVKIVGSFLEYGYGYTTIEVSVKYVKGKQCINIARYNPNKKPKNLDIPLSKIKELVLLLNSNSKKGCFMESETGYTVIEVYPLDINGVPYFRIAKDYYSGQTRSIALPLERIDDLVGLLYKVKAA